MMLISKGKIFYKRISALIAFMMICSIFIVSFNNIEVKAANLSTSQSGVDFIKSFENCKLTAYKAVSTEKYYTIGYGHYGADVYAGMTISQAQAEEMLKNDLKKYEGYVNTFLNNNGIIVTQNQFDALVSFTYNLGNVWVSTPVFQLKTILRNGVSNYSDTEITTAFTNWNKSNGIVLNGLTKRRKKEAELFLKGNNPISVKFQKDNSYPVPFNGYPATTSGKIMVYNGNLTAYDISKRYIAYNDLCTVSEVYTNGYCKVTYPTSSGSHTEYAKISDFIPNSVSRYGYKPSQNLITYTRSNFSTTFGSVFTTDDCTVVGKSGNLLQIIYPVSSGYKLGWIDPPVPSDCPVPLYAYNASPSERTTVYQSLSSMGTYYGQIFVDDKCTLNSVSISGGWINVTYPAGSGTKTGYVYLDQFIPSDSRLSTFYTASVSQQTTTYRKNDMSVSYGYVSVGDTITVVGKNGNKLQVLYPLDTGGYKLAWIYDTNVNKTLKEIYVASNPIKTTYLEGEGFNSSGLVVNAKYTDGSTSNVTNLSSLSGYSNTPGTKTINVTYGGKSAVFSVVVNEKSLTKIEITSAPSKTVYDVGENINLNGMKVNATYNNGTTSEACDYSIESSEVTSSLGEKAIKVNYTYNKVTKSASFKIIVCHNFGEWTTTQSASCGVSGIQVRKCSGCDYTETRTVTTKEHKYELISQKAASCTTDGEKKYKCSDCGDVKTENIKAIGHQYIEKIVAPTTTENGYTLHTCSVCGNSYKDNYTDMLKPVNPTSAQIIVDKITANAGKDVIVSISFKNNPGIAGFKFNIKYDTEVLTLKNAESVDIDAMFSENLTDYPFIASWESGVCNVSMDGEVVKLTFTVKENAPEGTYPIIVEIDDDNIYNIKEENIHFDIVNGSVTVKKHLSGDINNDGKVNMKDLTRLHQYINGWKVTVVQESVDVNGDGKVNMKDLTRLHQYINGWKVNIYVNDTVFKNISAVKQIYGKSEHGRDLVYYDFKPNGYTSTVLLNFAIHGFEDEYNADGQVLVDTANKLIELYNSNYDPSNKTRLVIIPCANPDGLYEGTTNYGFGRCNANGVDLNRDFDANYRSYSSAKNYTSFAFSAAESRALRDLYNELKPKVVIDFHGWENCTIGNYEIAQIFEDEMQLKHNVNFTTTNASGYFSNWAYQQGSYALLVEFTNSSSINMESLKKSIDILIENDYYVASKDNDYQIFDQINCYTISSDRVTTYQYFEKPFSSASYIDGVTDKVIILGIYENGWAKVQYPVSNGYKVAYCKVDEFINFSNKVTPYKYVVSSNTTVYKRENLEENFGIVYPTDECYVVAKTNDLLQIVYKLDSGGWKMGWIKK